MNLLENLLGGFVSLFYPKLCLSCGKNITPDKEAICLSCQVQLPKTNFHLEKENQFTDRFWGRVDIQTGTSFYHFSKGGRIQHLIHNLKYKGRSEVGVKLGQLYGKTLKNVPLYSTINIIIPVPLHPKKELKRGYNQSDMFAKGLSESMDVAWESDILVRTKMTGNPNEKIQIGKIGKRAGCF